MKKPLVIHPFMFGIFPILFLFSYNIRRTTESLGNITIDDIIAPIAIIICFTFGLYALLSFILKDKQLAGLSSSLFLLLFFSYGHVYIMGDFDNTIVRHRYLLPAFIFIWATSFYLSIKIRRDLHNLTNYLNIVAFSLVLISLVNIGVEELKMRVTWPGNESTEIREGNIVASGTSGTLRDIYYIILDGYASSRNLKECCDYDNTAFDNYLVSQDFYIASKSYSNYTFTAPSLASSMNMEYINYLTDVYGDEGSSTNKQMGLRLTQMIRDNKVARVLREKGYRYVYITSSTKHAKNVDIQMDVRCGRMSDFNIKLVSTTMFRALDGIFHITGEGKRKAVLCYFSKLADVQRIKGPKFVFSVIPVPHPPYVFGRNGEQIGRTKSTDRIWTPKEEYVDQLVFVSKQVQVLVQKLLSGTDILPIIILQGDHGPSFSSEPEPRESMRILNAYHLPVGGKDNLYDSITPVNSFRLIYNYYFNANYDLLGDRIYYSNPTMDEEVLKFIDITDKVRFDQGE